MSSDKNKASATFEKMMEESIKSQFEKNGTMAELRSEMHVKVLKLLRGQQDVPKPPLLTGEASKLNKGSGTRDHSLVKLINQLIMEFFNWFGYRHSLETFHMETGDDMALRSDLEERLFITPESKDLPLLAQLVMRDWKSSLAPVPENSKPNKEKLPTPRGKNILADKKLIQNNQKLIASDPYRKAITVKQMRTPPSPHPQPMAKKPERKVSVESSESDLLESDYSEESQDSDLYADIPDRHVFVDDLPPEGKYTPGQGEEGQGPYDAKQSLAECLYQRYQRGCNADDIPSSSQKAITPKGLKIKEMECNVSEGSESDGKTSSSGKQEKARKGKTIMNRTRSQTLGKNGASSADEHKLPVTRPECPETHISGIDFDSDDSYEDEASS